MAGKEAILTVHVPQALPPTALQLSYQEEQTLEAIWRPVEGSIVFPILC